MALIADSGAIYGLYDRRDRHHKPLRRALEKETGVVLIPVAILAEIDYLIRSKLGIRAEMNFLDDLLAGAFTLEPFGLDDLARSRDVLEQFPTLNLGLADAVVIATAERLQLRRILTVDERDFRAVPSFDGTPFTLVPADT